MMTTTRSTSLVELTKALCAFQGAIRSVPKRSVNPFYKSKYADLDAVWDMCRKPLSENGLAIVQTPIEIDGRMYLETMLLHTSGESITAQLALNVKELTPQSVGSAITYARRYSMSAMLGISADEDDDAEKATPKATVSLPEQPIAPKTGPATPGLTEAQLRAMLKDEGMEWDQFEKLVLSGYTWAEWTKNNGTPRGAMIRWGAYKKAHPALSQEAAARPAGTGTEAE